MPGIWAARESKVGGEARVFDDALNRFGDASAWTEPVCQTRVPWTRRCVIADSTHPTGPRAGPPDPRANIWNSGMNFLTKRLTPIIMEGT